MKSRFAYLAVLPVLLFFSVFLVIPALDIAYSSLLDRNLLTPDRFVGMDNYYTLLRDEKFWATLLNSVFYISVTPILIVFSLILSLIVRENTKRNRFFRIAFFMPVITPVIVAGILWKWMFNEDAGMMNFLIGKMGTTPVQWLTNFPANMISIMIITIWRGAGYYMMVFLAGLAVIDPQIEEAAMLDGANYFQRVIHIILPQLRRTISFIFVISSISAVKLFSELYVLMPGAPMKNKTLVYFLYDEAFAKFNFGYASAAGIALVIILSLLSYFNIKLLERNA